MKIVLKVHLVIKKIAVVTILASIFVGCKITKRADIVDNTPIHLKNINQKVVFLVSM